MLKFVLSAFVELDHLLSYFIRITLISAIIQHLLLEVIRQQCKWFRGWRCGNLPDELITELVLNTWLFQKNCLWLHVKDSVVLLAYSEPLLERAVIV